MERIDEKNDPDKSGDDFMMPGFRFHPTDEELVEFYLKRKLQHRPLQIELIKQVDIYKYDPWDLPKVASTGEKEWYFYCPRDRKYRNSTRPNRVTGAGFWKATGTDRPIYSSSHGDKCIGLKKSLVFYRGRAARGIKTDWMMHEFRLPCATDGGAHPPLYKTLPPTDSGAICRIFKKPSSTANRGIAHNWTTPSPSTTTPSDFEFGNPSALSIASNTTTANTSSANEDYNLAFSEASNASNKTAFDLASSLFFNQSPALYEEARKNSQSLDLESSQVIQLEGINGGDDQEGFRKNTWATNTHHLWENITAQDSWAPDLQWDINKLRFC